MKKILKMAMISLITSLSLSNCNQGNSGIDYYFSDGDPQIFNFDANSQNVDIAKAKQDVKTCRAQMYLFDDAGKIIEGSIHEVKFGEPPFENPLSEVDFEWVKLTFSTSRILIQVSENTTKYKRGINIGIGGPGKRHNAPVTVGDIRITQKKGI